MYRFRRLPCCALATCLLLAGASTALAQSSQAQQQADARKKLGDLHGKVESLSRERADTAAERTRLNDALARQSAVLAQAAKALHETDAAMAAKRRELEASQHEQAELTTHLKDQRGAIADLLRASYTLGSGSDLRLLLGDEDLAKLSRALAYSKYFQQDRAQRVAQLMSELARLKDLQDRIDAEQRALAERRQERAARAVALGRERAAQQQLASRADALYKDQGTRLAALKQDEQSLNTLVATLQKAIDQAAREAAAAAAREEAQARRHGRNPSSAPPTASASANIRGNLPWPASGPVNSYGNGVLIRAPGGSEVHAVARGKVVYASFLRGYGMLVIVNHGNGWMSMYGNNESLLVKIGDAVESGHAVGTASAVASVNGGVYFELRQGGKPVDPRSWLGRR